jgi:hypothetical protein
MSGPAAPPMNGVRRMSNPAIDPIPQGQRQPQLPPVQPGQIPPWMRNPGIDPIGPTAQARPQPQRAPQRAPQRPQNVRPPQPRVARPPAPQPPAVVPPPPALPRVEDRPPAQAQPPAPAPQPTGPTTIRTEPPPPPPATQNIRGTPMIPEGAAAGIARSGGLILDALRRYLPAGSGVAAPSGEQRVAPPPNVKGGGPRSEVVPDEMMALVKQVAGNAMAQGGPEATREFSAQSRGGGNTIITPGGLLPRDPNAPEPAKNRGNKGYPTTKGTNKNNPFQYYRQLGVEPGDNEGAAHRLQAIRGVARNSPEEMTVALDRLLQLGKDPEFAQSMLPIDVQGRMKKYKASAEEISKAGGSSKDRAPGAPETPAKVYYGKGQVADPDKTSIVRPSKQPAKDPVKPDKPARTKTEESTDTDDDE